MYFGRETNYSDLFFKNSDIDYLMGFKSYEDLLKGGFESMHGSVHVFVGGHMGHLVCSPSDPVFWMHHAFVDCIWQNFRNSSQATPLNEYPSLTPPAHDENDNMIPFTGLKNIDGMSTWTSHFYQYVQCLNAIFTLFFV